MNSVRIVFSVAVNRDCPIFRMDVNNAFLYGDLLEDVYMKQPPGYVAREESAMQAQEVS